MDTFLHYLYLIVSVISLAITGITCVAFLDEANRAYHCVKWVGRVAGTVLLAVGCLGTGIRLLFGQLEVSISITLLSLGLAIAAVSFLETKWLDFVWRGLPGHEERSRARQPLTP